MGSPTYATKVIAGIAVVDTSIVKAAQAYARIHTNDSAFNHVMRSWIFGALIYQRVREKDDSYPQIDLEVHAVSAILHDLGWDHTGELISNDKRFEVDGAIAARNWINEQREQGTGIAESWDEHKVQLVWDAIALHTTASIAKYKEPTVELCRLGIMSDFRGPDSDDSGTLTWEEFNAVKKEFPRHNLGSSVRDLFTNFCQTKPAATFDGKKPCHYYHTERRTYTITDRYQRGFGAKYVKGYKEKAEAYDNVAAEGIAAAIDD
jgi:hypothetical protein